MARKRICESLLYKSIALKKKHLIMSRFLIHVIRIVCACEVGNGLSIGEDVQFIHNGLGVVIHPKTVIDDRVMIYQNVTIGGNALGRGSGNISDRTHTGAPHIMKDTIIYAGAVVVGSITIGKNCIIGANAVVTRTVPDNSVVVGYNIVKRRIEK